jgi:two-component system aerobic respiration control sensor histidine kinase ArcB
VTHKDKGTTPPTTVTVADAGQFSFLSHDIRSSFSELSSGLNALSHTAQDPQSRRDVRELIAASDHLGRLLRDALTMVVGDHAIQPPEFGDTHIEEYLSILIQRWRKIVAAQGIHLEFHADKSLPVSVRIDILAVERILSNLVSNAAHHAHGEKIEVHAAYCAQQGLCISVRDHGQGFTLAQLETLFDFPPAPIGAGEPGSGYGLRIAYSLCVKMGGRLTAQNAKGGGALLALQLPVLEQADTPHVMSPETVKALLRGRTALVVDDSAVQRISLRAHLEAVGIQVQEVEDGAEAIQALAHQIFDVLLLDIEMPIFSGIDLLNMVKERNIALPPTIGITAHAFERNHTAIKDAGGLIVLNKPISNSAYLHDAILSALKHANGSNTFHLYDQTDSLGGAVEHIDSLRILIKTLNQNARHMFLEQLESELTLRLSQAYALTSREMSKTQRQELARTAHALAGLFATSYAHDAHQSALHLERIAFSAPRSEVIALLDGLSQDVSHIKKTIHLLKDKK